MVKSAGQCKVQYFVAIQVFARAGHGQRCIEAYPDEPHVVSRHHFSGPGPVIPCRADTIYLDEVRKGGHYDVIWLVFPGIPG